MSALLLIRHPPPLVANGLCYGRTDVSIDGSRLDALAHGWSEELQTLLADAPLAGLRLGRIITSPLLRCSLFATALANAVGHQQVLTDPRLQELDFGRWEGRLWTEIPRFELDAWAADMQGYAPGGRESAHDLQARVHEALSDYGLFDGIFKSGTFDIVVTHAGVIRAALVILGCAGWDDLFSTQWAAQLQYGAGVVWAPQGLAQIRDNPDSVLKFVHPPVV